MELASRPSSPSTPARLKSPRSGRLEASSIRFSMFLAVARVASKVSTARAAIPSGGKVFLKPDRLRTAWNELTSAVSRSRASATGPIRRPASPLATEPPDHRLEVLDLRSGVENLMRGADPHG